MFRYTRVLTLITVIALGSSVAACAGEEKVDIETVPVGAEVAVTRQDGGVVQGALTELSSETVKVSSSVGVREVPRKEIAEVQIVDAAVPAPPLPEIAKFREYTLPAGTELVVRLTTAVSSASSRVEDRVEATVTNAVTQGDTTVVPEGSILKGEVTAVEAAGKVKGRASLALRFRSLTIDGHDEPYAVVLGMSQLAPATKKADAAKIGIPAAAGGIIGGILGGKKGAITGVVIGGGAGTAVVLTTAGEEIDLGTGTVLTMTLDQPVDIRVPIIKK
jgi:hypothetical protein